MLGTGQRSLVARPPLWMLLSGSAAAQEVVLNGAQTLLDGETQGLAFDFTDQSAYIVDTGTPANDYDSTGTVSSGALVGPGGKLTYTSPSNKLCLQSDGYYKYGAHNEFYYSLFAGATAGSPGTAPTGWTWFSSGTVTNSAVIDTSITLTADTSARIFLNQTRTGVVGASYSMGVHVTVVSGTVTPADILHVVTATPTTISYTYDGASVTSSTTLTGSGVLRWNFSIAGSTTVTCRIGLGTAAGVSNAISISLKQPQLSTYPCEIDYISNSGGSGTVYSLPYEYDTSGACKGLLVEEARTNLLQYNTSFSTSWWSTTGNNSTVTANQDTAPNGLTQMTLLADDSGGGTGFCRINSPFVTVTSGSNTISVYAKPGGCNYLTIQTASFDAAGNGVTIFNLTTGAVSLNDANHTGETATLMSDGVTWRFQITFSTTTDLNGLVYIGMSEGGASTIDVPRDGTSSIYVWGAQLEAGSFPTSPIITYGSTATRAVDNISIATSAFPYSATAGSVYEEFTPSQVSSFTYLMELTDGTFNERVAIGTTASTGVLNAVVTDGGVGQVNASTSESVTANATSKAAVGYELNNTGWVLDGGTVVSDGACTMPTCTSLIVGNRHTGAGATKTHIKSISYVPRRKSDSELQTETT